MLILPYGVVLYSSKQSVFSWLTLGSDKVRRLTPPARVRKGHNTIRYAAHKPLARFVEGI